MSEPTTVLVGLGGNLGDRATALALAREQLAAAPGVELVRSSDIYETAPWGYPDQPSFLNQVVEIATSLGPVQILLLFLKIEADLGRERTSHWGPRRIDLDLLVFGNVTVHRPGLIVPHPLMEQRAFVLAPLGELWPCLRLSSGKTVEQALSDIGESQPFCRLDLASAGPPVR